jgi:UDP-GlcNAc:undecaprenyl-phosphate/decaprenyl-phosphate GlcNAc-1-phosphate transferase
LIWLYTSSICIAFALCVALTPFVRRIAFCIGAIDVPNDARKIHKEPTAALGGLGVAIAFCLTLAALQWLFPEVEAVALWRLALPASVIIALGMWDDVSPMKPRYKLLLQCAAAACFYWAGFRLNRVFAMDIPPWASFPATVLWLVSCANAMNLFDGMDGLASGLTVVVSLALFALAGYQGKVEIAVISAAIAGASMGFLLFNFPPAVIFLGDTGSLFLGMILGVVAIEGSFKSHLTFALIVPVIALGLPIMDTLLAIMRRMSRRMSIFSADKEHIHHKLVSFGFTRRQALVLLYGTSVILASVSLLTAFSGSMLAGGLIIVAGLGIVLLARILGGSEVRDFGHFVLRAIGIRRSRDASLNGERPLRIAFLTPVPTPYRQPLIEKLVERDDFEMVIYYFSASESDRSWHIPIPEEDARFRTLPVKSLSFMGKKSFINHWNPGLWRELDKGEFELVVIPGYALLSSQVAILWAWWRGKPYVIHSESHLAEPRSWIRRLVKTLFVRQVISRAAACFATGTLSKEYLCKFGAQPESVAFFPNTPDVNWFMEQSGKLRPIREELRRKWGISAVPTVIFVGRLLQVKGVDVLIRSLAITRKHIPNAQLVIVGDGPEEAILRQLAQELVTENGVKFMGFHDRDKLVELYACADVFCLPSRHEPWGVVVNEAAACGLPLVVSDRVGAHVDMVAPSQNGCVVPVDDDAALSAALVEVLGRVEDIPSMSKISRQRAVAMGYESALEQFSLTLRGVFPERIEQEQQQ